MQIKWGRIAVKQLISIIQYLEDNNSKIYAEKLEKALFLRINALPQKTKIYQIDRLKQLNDGSFYAFEIDRYRVSFRVVENQIHILRIRHTGRRPFTR